MPEGLDDLAAAQRYVRPDLPVGHVPTMGKTSAIFTGTTDGQPIIKHDQLADLKSQFETKHDKAKFIPVSFQTSTPAIEPRIAPPGRWVTVSNFPRRCHSLPAKMADEFLWLSWPSEPSSQSASMPPQAMPCAENAASLGIKPGYFLETPNTSPTVYYHFLHLCTCCCALLCL